MIKPGGLEFQRKGGNPCQRDDGYKIKRLRGSKEKLQNIESRELVVTKRTISDIRKRAPDGGNLHNQDIQHQEIRDFRKSKIKASR